MSAGTSSGCERKWAMARALIPILSLKQILELTTLDETFVLTVANEMEQEGNTSSEKRDNVVKNDVRKFKLGDVVQLNSGGERMTVIDQQCCGNVQLAIGQIDKSEGQLIYEQFPEACLMLAQDLETEIPF